MKTTSASFIGTDFIAPAPRPGTLNGMECLLSANTHQIYWVGLPLIWLKPHIVTPQKWRATRIWLDAYAVEADTQSCSEKPHHEAWHCKSIPRVRCTTPCRTLGVTSSARHPNTPLICRLSSGQNIGHAPRDYSLSSEILFLGPLYRS